MSHRHELKCLDLTETRQHCGTQSLLYLCLANLVVVPVEIHGFQEYLDILLGAEESFRQQDLV